LPGKDSQHRTVYIRQPGKEIRNRTGKTGKAEQDTQNWIAGTGPAERDCQERTAWTGLSGQDWQWQDMIARTELSASSCQHRTAVIRQPGGKKRKERTARKGPKDS
jgi:hypothetical protein